MGNELREEQHEIEVAAPRKRRVGSFMIRESLLAKVRQGIESGLAFADAAEGAGVPYELMLAQISHDEEIRKWFLECRGRKSLMKGSDYDILPEARKPIDIKREIIHKLHCAGLVDTIAETAAFIQPVKEDGTIDDNHFRYMKQYMDFMAKVTPSENHNVNKEVASDFSKHSDEDLARILIERKMARAELEEKERHAAEVRKSGGLKENPNG